MKLSQISIGYEVGTGREVLVPLSHTAVCGQTQAAQVRRWAKLEKLPIDRFYDTAGRLIVCHKDAEVLRAL